VFAFSIQFGGNLELKHLAQITTQSKHLSGLRREVQFPLDCAIPLTFYFSSVKTVLCREIEEMGRKYFDKVNGWRGEIDHGSCKKEEWDGEQWGF